MRFRLVQDGRDVELGDRRKRDDAMEKPRAHDGRSADVQGGRLCIWHDDIRGVLHLTKTVTTIHVLHVDFKWQRPFYPVYIEPRSRRGHH